MHREVALCVCVRVIVQYRGLTQQMRFRENVSGQHSTANQQCRIFQMTTASCHIF